MHMGQQLATDYEEVPCCRCGLEGVLLYRQGRFGIVRCPQCRLVFTSPRLTKEAMRAIYDDSDYFDDGVYGFSQRLNLAMLLQEAWTRGRLGLIRDCFGDRVQGKTLLEIGCAYGFFLEAARRRGFEVTGIEYSRAAIQWIAANRSLDVHHGELKDAPVPPAHFDVICFWDVLEHIDQPVEFLALVRQHLKATGVILFSTPYVSSLPARLLGPRWWTLRPEQHLSHFTPATLALLFRDAGMSLERVLRNPLSLPNIGRLDSLVGIARPAAV